MEVDFAFLADAAQDTPDGKLYVMGGAFDTIWSPNVPFTYQRPLAFVMRLLFNPAELGRKHKVEISLMDADGKRLAAVGGDLGIQRKVDLPTGWPQGFLAVLNLSNIKFERFGDYSFDILANDSHLKSIRLRIAQRPQQMTREALPPKSPTT